MVARAEAGRVSSPRPGCTPLHTYVAPPRGQRPGCVAQPGVRPVLLPFVFQHHFELKHALPHACFTPFFLPIDPLINWYG